MLAYALPVSKPQYSLLARGDWLGIALMVVGLAALQTVLDEGNVLDWFGSPLIVQLSLVAAIAVGAFLFVQFTRGEPLLNLRLLGRRNFGFGTTANVMLGFALYGAAYLQPQYLANAQGYNAQQIGAVMAWTGLPQLMIIPLVPMMMRRLDARVMVVIGLTMFATSSFMNLNLDANDAGPQLFLPNVVRALGQAISLAPLSTIAMAGITSQEAGNASGIYNMLRNLGGAVGTAMVETFYTRREQYHSFIINRHVSLLQPATRERLAHMQQYFLAHGADSASALHSAIIAIGRTIQRQSMIMAFGDSFALLGIALLLGAAAVFPMRKGAPSGGGAAH
jgi:DHA2 family multidrug resistance protein